jgi:hypothetical protein
MSMSVSAQTRLSDATKMRQNYPGLAFRDALGNEDLDGENNFVKREATPDAELGL